LYKELSVSSVGSSGMQQPLGALRLQPFSFFQYPRSDRAGCNFHSPTRVLASGSLSVSSVGSSGMQLAQGNNPVQDFATFSILGRIERDATVVRPGHAS